MKNLTKINNYKIAVLCYLFNEKGELLLLNRYKEPNKNLFSPIGGKLEQTYGESPHECAIREISEETGLELSAEKICCIGIVTEKSYQETHWMIFLYRSNEIIESKKIKTMEFEEGKLEWIPVKNIEKIAIPPTDRQVMWPLVKKHPYGFFIAHINCEHEPPSFFVYQSKVLEKNEFHLNSKRYS